MRTSFLKLPLNQVSYEEYGTTKYKREQIVVCLYVLNKKTTLNKLSGAPTGAIPGILPGSIGRYLCPGSIRYSDGSILCTYEEPLVKVM